MGWNSTTASAQCGEGYGPRTYGCMGCAPGYYQNLQICVKCPGTNSSRVEAVFQFIGVMAALFLVTFGIMVLVTRKRGGSIGNSVFRARDFVAWSMITWQTIIQVGKRTARAPYVLQRFYSVISVLELDTTVILSPQCYAHNPFTSQLYELSGSVIAVTLVLSMFVVPRIPALFSRIPGFLKKIIPTLQRMTMSLLVLTYPLITNAALDMVNCADGQLIVDYDTGATKSAYILQSHTAYPCYTGYHAGVGVLAWFPLWAHVIGFPCVTFAYLFHKRRSFELMPAEWKRTWVNYIAQDYKPQYFWFVHWNMLVLFLLSVLLVFGTKANTGAEVGTFLGTTFLVTITIAMMYKLRPYVPRKEWKMHVKALVLIVTFASCLGNLLEFTAKSPSARRGATGWSYVVFVLCIILVITFVVLFWWSILGGWEDSKSDIAKLPATSADAADAVATTNPLHARKSADGSSPHQFNPMFKGNASSVLETPVKVVARRRS